MYCTNCTALRSAVVPLTASSSAFLCLNLSLWLETMGRRDSAEVAAAPLVLRGRCSGNRMLLFRASAMMTGAREGEERPWWRGVGECGGRVEVQLHEKSDCWLQYINQPMHIHNKKITMCCYVTLYQTYVLSSAINPGHG